MLALTHSAANGNASLLPLVILAAIAIAMFWRVLLKLGIIIVVIMVLITIVTGFWALMTGLHQIIIGLHQIIG